MDNPPKQSHLRRDSEPTNLNKRREAAWACCRIPAWACHSSHAHGRMPYKRQRRNKRPPSRPAASRFKYHPNNNFICYNCQFKFGDGHHDKCPHTKKQYHPITAQTVVQKEATKLTHWGVTNLLKSGLKAGAKYIARYAANSVGIPDWILDSLAGRRHILDPAAFR